MSNVSNQAPELKPVNIKKIANDAYTVVKSIGEQREELMASIQKAVTDKTATTTKISITLNGKPADLDISTGAGALVLDDYLQELSTVEQAAAQFVSAENKAQKQIHSITGQG